MKGKLKTSQIGICQCGCGEQTKLITENDASQGLIKGTYRKFINHHRVKSPYEYLVDNNGCWLWQRGKTSAGYGENRGQYAHRYYYQVYKGKITDGFDLDHLCHVRSCVNPDHLEAVPHAINCRRGYKARLTQEDVHEIRRLLNGCFLNNVQIGTIIGCSSTTIGNIKVGKRWAS